MLHAVRGYLAMQGQANLGYAGGRHGGFRYEPLQFRVETPRRQAQLDF